MKAEISSRTVVKSQVQIMRSLECKMQVNNEWMTGLFEDVGFVNLVLELLLEDEVFLFEGLQSIKVSSCNVFSQEDFTECTTAQS